MIASGYVKERPVKKTLLETYFREIDETPLLNAREELELAERIGEGDVEAREEMIRANLRLVVNIARRYADKGLSLEDLIAEGNLGLLRAVEGFDPTAGTRFSTYACFWIKQSIRHGLCGKGKTIRLPRYMHALLAKWRQAAADLQEQLGYVPTEEEIAGYLKMSAKKLKIIKMAIRVYNATPQADLSTEDGEAFVEGVADNGSFAPDARASHSDDLKQVLRRLDELDERSATVLRMRFGLNGEEPKTLKEISDILGLTRERVRQIERSALTRLRNGLVDD